MGRWGGWGRVGCKGGGVWVREGGGGLLAAGVAAQGATGTAWPLLGKRGPLASARLVRASASSTAEHASSNTACQAQARRGAGARTCGWSAGCGSGPPLLLGAGHTHRLQRPRAPQGACSQSGRSHSCPLYRPQWCTIRISRIYSKGKKYANFQRIGIMVEFNT